MPTPKKKPARNKNKLQQISASKAARKAPKKPPTLKTRKTKAKPPSKAREKVAAKKLAKGFTEKTGQPIPESPFSFLKMDEIPSTLEVAKLAVSLALAEKGKPSPDRALAFLEETAGIIRMTKNHIIKYEHSIRPPKHLDFKKGIRYILCAKGQARPKRELEQFKPVLGSYLLHEAMESAYEMEDKDEYFTPPHASDFCIEKSVEDYIEKTKKEGFNTTELTQLKSWNLDGQFDSRFRDEFDELRFSESTAGDIPSQSAKTESERREDILTGDEFMSWMSTFYNQ